MLTEENGASAPAVGNCTDAVIIITSNRIGNGSKKLGHTLMRGFLYALSQMERPPKSVIFMNSGVRLTSRASDSLEDLMDLATRGTEILSCGTCLDFYGIREDLAVGNVITMYKIAQRLADGEKIVTL